jgi:hypothetical protein
MEANLNITVSNPKIIINDFEVEDESKFKNTNIEFDDDTETLDLTKEYDNYNNVMNVLGLNAEINYPIRVLADAIVELHLVQKTDTQKQNMNYGRIYEFRKNKLSILLKNNLFPPSTSSTSYGISYYDVKNKLKQLIRTHKYNIITDSINILNNAGLAKPIKEVIGFNFNNPRWVALYDFNI